MCSLLRSSGCLLGSCCRVVRRFLDSGGRVFGHVLACGHHQFDGVHLDLFRDLGEGGHILGRNFSLSGGEIGHRFCIVSRLCLCFGHVAQLGKRVLCPLRGDFGRLFSRFNRNVGQLFVQSRCCLKRVLHGLRVHRERTHHFFHGRCHVWCLSHCLKSFPAWRAHPAVLCR